MTVVNEYIVIPCEDGDSFTMSVNTPKQVREALRVMYQECLPECVIYQNGVPVGSLHCDQE
jgi:hypothetical protein